MGILKFFKNLFGSSDSDTVNNEVVTVESPTKVEEPISNTVVETPVITIVEEVKVEEVKKTEEPKKTAKEIKAKVRKPSSPQSQTQKSVDKKPQQNGSKPRPKRKNQPRKGE
jgi:hypothetical protein